MLSGICPRGSSNAPGNGNTGMISSRSAGLVYTAFIGMDALPWSNRSRSNRHFCSKTFAPSLQLRRRHAKLAEVYCAGNLADRPSREQNRGQSFAPVDGCLVRRPPYLEELHQLLARTIIVPFAVALDDL